MESTNIHEVIINKDNQQTISADAAFYSFIGDRLYFPFAKFVAEEDQNLFYQKFQECTGERFVLRLSDEEIGRAHV